MIKLLYHAARAIRHAPVLSRMTPVWDALRLPYQRVIDRGNGVKFVLGRGFPVFIPAQYSQFDWEGYEVEAMDAVGQWITDHPSGLVLDVGCAVGIVSALALWRSQGSSIIAFDADLDSLAATRTVLARAERTTGRRSRLVHGLLTAKGESDVSLEHAIGRTDEQLSKIDASTAEPKFVCLTDPVSDDIPRYSLDGLLSQADLGNRPILIKIDVEGAELLVLQGAFNVLRSRRPSLLVSVHPQFLGQYACNASDIRRLLDTEGYNVTLLQVDHEEHWWCAPRDSTASASDGGRVHGLPSRE